jgi:hypothetical protein
MRKLTIGDVLRPSPAPIYWHGESPDRCIVCRQPFRNSFIDGATRAGRWGLLDLACHRVHGLGLGVGKGQLFRRQPDGRWLKTEG